MNTAFTPGPWDYDSTDFDVYDMESGESLDITEANARLIAAAPELLAALIALYAVSFVEEDKDYAAVANALAAIDKATGAAA